MTTKKVFHTDRTKSPKPTSTAKLYLSYGLNPVPTKPDSKAPVRENHSTVKITEGEINNYDFTGIGISTGAISQGLEALDFDLKNSSNPSKTMKDWKKRVDKDLLKRLVVQQTPSGGYHFIYRCEKITSSKKLCKNSKGLAIIETRGEGGFIKCHPSANYELIQGSLEFIPIISPEERLQLFVAAKLLSETLVKDANKRLSKEDKVYLTKFPDYNNNIQIGIDLLLNKGWTEHSEDNTWINLTRPESTSGDLHAGYNKEGKFLFVFSTSQPEFETEKPYNNHAIYAELECDGNYEVAYAKLFKEGHGVDGPKEKDEETFKDSLESLSFLSDEVEENDYLDQARKGEIAQGRSTGWRALDEHMRLKPNSLNFSLGYDGVGKSAMMLSLAAASNVLHGDTWGMIMPENKTAMSRKRLMEAMYGRSVESYANEPDLFQSRLEYLRKNFHIIANKKHYTISEALEYGKRLFEVFGIKNFLIDPFNFFKVVGNNYSSNNEILSEMRVFTEKYCSIIVMAHPSSNSPRTNVDDLGYLKPPSKYDIQGGADFPYRVDDFSVFHRVVNADDATVRKTMQIIMEKVKEVETGGKVHIKGEYTSLVWEVRDGFLGYWDEYGDNPMYRALQMRGEVRERLRDALHQQDKVPLDDAEHLERKMGGVVRGISANEAF